MDEDDRIEVEEMDFFEYNDDVVSDITFRFRDDDDDND